MAAHVDTRPDESHPLATQTRAMAWKRRTSIGVHDSMERQVAFVAVP
jgi:hypothetical protein